VFVSPSSVADTAQCQQQANERDSVATHVPTNVLYGRPDPNPPAHRESLTVIMQEDRLDTKFIASRTQTGLDPRSTGPGANRDPAWSIPATARCQPAVAEPALCESRVWPRAVTGQWRGGIK
jgi:hypothetical protein